MSPGMMIHILQLGSKAPSRVQRPVPADGENAPSPEPLRIKSALGLISGGHIPFGWSYASTPPGSKPGMYYWELQPRGSGSRPPGNPGLSTHGQSDISENGAGEPDIETARRMAYIAGRTAPGESTRQTDLFAALAHSPDIPVPAAIVNRVVLPGGEYYPDIVLNHGLEEMTLDLRIPRDIDSGGAAGHQEAVQQKAGHQEAVQQKETQQEAGHQTAAPGEPEEKLFLREFYRCFTPFCAPHQLHCLVLNPRMGKHLLYPALHGFMTYLDNISDLERNPAGEA